MFLTKHETVGRGIAANNDLKKCFTLNSGIIVFAVTLLITSHSAIAKTNWHNEYGNPACTKSLAINTNPSKFHILWKKPINTDSSSTLFSIWDRMIVNNIYFTTYKLFNNDGVNTSDIIEAIDSETGEKIWSDTRDTAIHINYARGYLLEYFWDYKTLSHHIRALNEKSGDVYYDKELPEDTLTLLSDDKQTYYTSLTNDIIGNLDGLTGIVNWSVSVPKSILLKSSFAFNEKYLISRDYNTLYLFDRLNGAYIDKITASDVEFSQYMGFRPVTLDNNTAYVLFSASHEHSISADLYALDLTYHNVKWKVQNLFYDQLVLSSNTVFAVTQDEIQRVNAINAETGKISWSWKIPPEDASFFHAPYMVATNDILFVAGLKHLYAISLTTHDIAWRGDFAATDLALGNNKLFFTVNLNNGNSELYALALS